MSIDERIAEMFTQGRKGKEISHSVGLTAHGVYQRIKRMRYAGIDLPSPFAPKLGLVQPNVEKDPRRASIMHLVDLKRAGHSPTKTELAIEPERYHSPRAYPVWGSCVGSPALSCVNS